MNGVQEPSTPPLVKIITDGSFGRKVVGKITPAAAVGQKIKDGIEDFSQVGGTRSTTAVNREERFNDSPLGIGQVGGISLAGGIAVHESVSVKGKGVKGQRRQGNKIQQKNNVNIFAKLPHSL